MTDNDLTWDAWQRRRKAKRETQQRALEEAQRQTYTLTPKQKRAWVFIASYIHTHQLPPTMREISAHLGNGVGGTVYGIMAALQEKGYIVRNPASKGKARAYSLFVWPTPAELTKLEKEAELIRSQNAELTAARERIEYGYAILIKELWEDNEDG